ncbi:MAG: hypothetical protein JXB42_12520 [Deltaproteobacteria bacterium]|nr:hypothetical protein [Deltaproteobacteria bacterium]
MSTDNTKLRGNKQRLHSSWPLGQFSQNVITEIGKQLVHRLAVGHSDITGDDFGTIFAKAVGGIHRESPLGIADVLLNGNAWSVKTVKANRPFNQNTVRLISGRNSPDYSLGIENLHKDIQATGKAVLAIWNARVNESLGEHDDLRIAVLIRNLESKEFVIFEEDANRYAADDYRWSMNNNGNLEGHEKVTGEHKFTWQFHGSQFTIIRNVPGSAAKFIINRNVPLIEPVHVLRLVRFEDDWIEIVE